MTGVPSQKPVPSWGCLVRANRGSQPRGNSLVGGISELQGAGNGGLPRLGHSFRLIVTGIAFPRIPASKVDRRADDVCIRCSTQEYVKNDNFVPAGRMRDSDWRWRRRRRHGSQWLQSQESRLELEPVGVDRFGWSRSQSWSRQHFADSDSDPKSQANTQQ